MKEEVDKTLKVVGVGTRKFLKGVFHGMGNYSKPGRSYDKASGNFMRRYGGKTRRRS